MNDDSDRDSLSDAESIYDGSSDEENDGNAINVDRETIGAAVRLIKLQPLKKAARNVKTKSRTDEELRAFHEEVEEYLTGLFNFPYCFARYQGRFVSCRCLQLQQQGNLRHLAIRLGELFCCFIFYYRVLLTYSQSIILVSFADYPRNIRETILKERISSAISCSEDFRKRRRVLERQRDLTRRTTHFRYKLGEEGEKDSNICVHAFRNFFCIGKRMWLRLRKEATTRAPGPTMHGNTGLQNRHHGSLVFQTEPDVVGYLQQLGEEHGESYATRFIRERTSIGLRGEEVDAVDLPSHFTKRQLYKR